MEALFCKRLGDPASSLSSSSPIEVCANYPIPELDSPTAVKVKVKVTSLNYANYLQILGKYQEKPPLPFIPGSDYANIVDAVGPAFTNFKVGDHVSSFADFGSYAAFIVQDQSLLFGVPKGCDLVAAAALPGAFGTSHVALLHRVNLTSSQVLLVLGAAGGVGVAAVQIGKVCGAVVIAVARFHFFFFLFLNSNYLSTVHACYFLLLHCYHCSFYPCQESSITINFSGAEKVQFLKSLGVDHVVDLTNQNVTASIKEFLKSRNLKGVDVLYDPVGGKLTKETMKLLNWGAQILVVGFASGEIPVIPANSTLVKNWTVHGFFLGFYRRHRPAVFEDSIQELLSWMEKGLITIHISHAYSLSEANLAFSAIKDRKAIGKVMIAFDDEGSV